MTRIFDPSHEWVEAGPGCVSFGGNEGADDD